MGREGNGRGSMARHFTEDDETRAPGAGETVLASSDEATVLLSGAAPADEATTLLGAAGAGPAGTSGLPPADEDTDARWEPMSDEEWAMTMAAPEPASDTGAAAAVDEWLEPSSTLLQPRAVGTVPSPGDTAPGPRVAVTSPTAGEAGGAWEPEAAAGGAGPAGGGPSRRGREPREHGPRPARHGCLSLLLWLVMLGVLALMALRMLPSELANGRLVPEVVSFVPWLFAPILVCLVLAALWRRRLLLVVTVAALATMAWWHRGFLLPGSSVSDAAALTAQTAADTSDNVARVMTLNTKNGDASAEEVVALVREKNVEVLCLQELSDEFLGELAAAGIYDVLPYYVISDAASEVSNGGRNGIWTMAPMSNVSGNLLPIETSSMPAGTIEIGGRAVRVVSVHPNSPVRGAQDLWDEGLSVIGSLSDYDHTYLVMGDFNSTWNHARFRELLGSGFVDAGEQAGEGFHMTYPSGALPSLIEIDHIVYARDSGIVVSELEAVEVSGTDHRALIGVLEVS